MGVPGTGVAGPLNGGVYRRGFQHTLGGGGGGYGSKCSLSSTSASAPRLHTHKDDTMHSARRRPLALPSNLRSRTRRQRPGLRRRAACAQNHAHVKMRGARPAVLSVVDVANCWEILPSQCTLHRHSATASRPRPPACSACPRLHLVCHYSRDCEKKRG